MRSIIIRGARHHNLRDFDLEIPRNRLVVITGLSGSGKSSLAFDTLYAEGQRRYIESLSSYARQFLEQLQKPDVDSVEGLSPAISIEQKTTSRNVRSTVGTITEVYDYLRLLFSSIGVPNCPRCGQEITRQSVEQIVDQVLALPAEAQLLILAPVVRERKGEFKQLFDRYLREGYLRARVDGHLMLLEEVPPLNKRRNHTIEVVVDRLPVGEDFKKRIESSVRNALRIAEGLVTVAVTGGQEHLFSEKMACVNCGINVPALEPRSFSFNSRFGACPVCRGLGRQRRLNLERLIEDPECTLESLNLRLKDGDFERFFRESLSALLEALRIDPQLPFSHYPKSLREALRNGIDQPLVYRFKDFTYESNFPGVEHWFSERIKRTTSTARRAQLMNFMAERPCRSCGGTRLRPESRAVNVNGLTIAEFCQRDLKSCLAAIDSLVLNDRQEAIAGQILEEIRTRLSFMTEVGLSYLTLDRPAASLAGGEAQRIRLATQVGSQLQGVLYVLDEPSIGLHARDTRRLLAALQALRDLGNTIILVEHDEETIRCADFVVDLGPGGGTRGGYVLAAGSVDDIVGCPESLTGRYLKGSLSIPVPDRRRSGSGKQLRLLGVRHNNLRNVDVSIPLGKLVVVTGVSGSGKSSLVDEVLYRALSQRFYRSLLEPGEHDAIEGLEHLDKVIEIDQTPIGRTPRSNPATYTGLFTPIRALFARLPESRIRGYKPGRFSFNVKGGRCEVCRGAGLRRIEMNFLPDVYVECESCRGKRYNRETLAVRYKGCSIADLLGLTIEEAYPVLEKVPAVETRLRTLLDVGLGYISLGQPATTLSGGEAQRVKLSRELSKRATGSTLYILDEPTTGLHFDDVRKLLNILQDLVELGNTVIVIEHNLEVIKCADWIIDLGPEGGNEGGQVVAEGTPETLQQVAASYTGQALAGLLAGG